MKQTKPSKPLSTCCNYEIQNRGHFDGERPCCAYCGKPVKKHLSTAPQIPAVLAVAQAKIDSIKPLSTLEAEKPNENPMREYDRIRIEYYELMNRIEMKIPPKEHAKFYELLVDLQELRYKLNTYIGVRLTP